MEISTEVFRVVALERDLVMALAFQVSEEPEGRELFKLICDEAVKSALDGPLDAALDVRCIERYVGAWRCKERNLSN